MREGTALRSSNRFFPDAAHASARTRRKSVLREPHPKSRTVRDLFGANANVFFCDWAVVEQSKSREPKAGTIPGCPGRKVRSGGHPGRLSWIIQFSEKEYQCSMSRKKENSYDDLR